MITVNAMHILAKQKRQYHNCSTSLINYFILKKDLKIPKITLLMFWIIAIFLIDIYLKYFALSLADFYVKCLLA